MISTRRTRRAAGWIAAGGFVALAALFVAPAARAQQMAVDVELVLGIDCSYSVNSDEFDLQMRGLAQAFESTKVLQAIQGTSRGVIAVTVVQWSDGSSQEIAVPWTLVYDANSAQQFARAIRSAPRLAAIGTTSISAMVEIGVALFNANQFAGDRRVIDISADGFNNTGPPMPLLRLYAEKNEVTLNGLAIINEHPELESYFQYHVITGPGAFVITANGYAAYSDAITRKLLREIIKPIS